MCCVQTQSQEPRILASDLKYLQEDLQLKKASIYRSIPYSRFGSNRDAHCYRKAYPQMVAFKVSAAAAVAVVLAKCCAMKQCGVAAASLQTLESGRRFWQLLGCQLIIAAILRRHFLRKPA